VSTTLYFFAPIRTAKHKPMERVKERMKEASSLLENQLVSAGVASLAGSMWYIFRKGPYQAVKLGIASKRWNAPIHSIRAADIEQLKNRLASLTGERYAVVRGPKGVGKTCIVDTMLEKRPGVLRFDVPAGKSYDDIMYMVFSTVSGNGKNLQSCKSHAKGVLKWYNRFFGRYPFVIAIQAKERFPSDPSAHIGPAARDLGGFGFKVLVDASQHALADKETEREEYVDIDFMSKDLLFMIPEFQSFYNKLEACQLKEHVWQVLGGNPNRVQRLVNACNGKEDIDDIVVDFLFSCLQDAKKALDAELLRFPSLKELLKSFGSNRSIGTEEMPVPFSEVKCLRVIHNYLVPSNPTLNFLLHIGMDGLNLNSERLSLQEKKEKLKLLVEYAKS
jgi:hypothetical protein